MIRRALAAGLEDFLGTLAFLLLLTAFRLALDPALELVYGLFSRRWWRRWWAQQESSFR